MQYAKEHITLDTQAFSSGLKTLAIRGIHISRKKLFTFMSAVLLNFLNQSEL